ncbi:MAG: glycosyl hydrolase family 65 protein [Candidatus Omnitrophota bacterium]
MYSEYLRDELWLIRETKWLRSLQNIRESQFTLGNGYFCVRGFLEGVPYGSHPGVFIAGLYDKMGSQVDELANLPNPVNFRFSIEGQKLEAVTMDIVRHQRTLNLKKALLARSTLFRDAKKMHYDLQSLRFISMHDKNIGAMQISVTPLDSDCTLDINTGIDTSVVNTASFSEGRRKHFRVRELGQYEKAGYLVADTLEKKHTIVYWSGFYYQHKGKKTFAKDNVFRLALKKNQTVVFTKIFFLKHFPHKADPRNAKQHSFSIFNKAFRGSFPALLNNHIGSWESLWKKADVVVGGTADLQRNLRFNIYHMLICANYDEGFSSIGARTLSAEGYRGHIFWDADIFMMPFYLFNFPRLAKNMLLYRCKRLAESRKLARKEGYKGAKFAWESASTGEEETPAWARDIDGTISRVHTHLMEHHITACVAYACYKYFVATEDHDFMKKYGYELLFETARFWASRAAYNKRRKKYEINHVIGPDEFHVDVNNNAFTNMMAKWNLLIASKLFSDISKDRKYTRALLKKLNMEQKEALQWKKTASRMAVTVAKDKIIEQFDGYHTLKKVTLDTTDENGIPLLPGSIKAKNIGKTQLIKQADVVMLLYLLNDVFSAKTKKANFDHYIARTAHRSSLSASICSLMACELQNLNLAYNLFNVSLRADISNLYGNTHEGIHAASLGGTWQAAVFGFGGVRITKERLCINPVMPRTWDKMSFSLFWKNALVTLELTNDVIKLKMKSKKGDMTIGIFDKPVTIKSGRVYVFKRAVPKYKKEYFYY